VMRMCFPVMIALLLGLLFSSNTAAQDPKEVTSPEKRPECKSYSVRRIEFINNTHTRDRYLRRPITLSEGKMLSEKDIESTIRKLNRLKRIEKLTRKDIIIGYGVDDPGTPNWYCFADVSIRIKEKK
jgi:hypothetical protein